MPPSIDTTQQLQLQTHQLQQAGTDLLVQNGDTGPKRLHVTNIPFRFRDHDLVQMFGVSFDDDDDDDYDNYDNNNRFIY